MVTTTQITDISRLLDLSDFYDNYTADYDTEAVLTDYIAALQTAAQEIAPTVTVHRNGMVFAEVQDADAARELDWRELADGIDMDPILAAHEA